MSQEPASINPIGFETRNAMQIAGLRLRLNDNAAQEIPALWQKLVPYLGKIPTQIGSSDYGVCIRVDHDDFCFDYLAGIEVADASSLPDGWTTITVPAQRYAVFAHTEHVSHLRNTIHNIFDQWLPNSTCKHVQDGLNAVHFFERYGEGFNPHTGFGDIQIWLPVQA